MGLDMYCYKVSKEVADEAGMTPDSLISLNGNTVADQFAYWRKFNALHGWMEKLYVRKGGVDEFNCRPVRLDLADIEKLEEDAKAGRLEATAGFFFGPQDPLNEDDRDEVLEFCAKARAALADGFALYYDSWW